ncbi:aldo/keto reductase [Patulibacter brassicae]|uniref:Aldo/keto reductase n=1 Tax=Patulibacter brassicae TaxID=1705717 RepID=A0ABU4VNI1_9ACTN|nr:aldo/keto reductase [Patulibacter brassicae]MDX8153411.1 aldo/keto reductase [Patulibacter brassicae]
MVDLGHAALGAWGGGRFMHFGRPLDEEEVVELLRPDDRLRTVITADVYGAGDADRVVGRAIAGRPRDEVRLVGAIGHDFYDGERQGAKGFPRFTSPALRGPEGYADYLRRACEASLERCGTDRFDLLLLHNPDRIGYTSEAVWEGLVALRDEGLTGGLGIAPGPANGFTLDVLTCLDRFGDEIDWAMLILGPAEPWPGRLALEACVQHDVRVLTRVTDYGGAFWGDLTPQTPMGEWDHRRFRPDGWIERAGRLLREVATIGAARGLTPMQVAAQWTLAQPAVACVVPTLIEELPAPEGVEAPAPRPILEKRAELAALPREQRLTTAELDRITQLGDNSGCMALKGASPVFEGDEQPDGWGIGTPQLEAARRWGIDPDRELVKTH